MTALNVTLNYEKDTMSNEYDSLHFQKRSIEKRVRFYVEHTFNISGEVYILEYKRSSQRLTWSRISNVN
jgi:hypothetical protein